ncbi:MAG: outer membrane beta-barrel protein [Candidatus Devosia phytovorans]|uniref:Outer membrane beta-barrel protein n=1 Tax=Candidatus Devosia phytovorans TaxID=3121372 RepID=A0AAJ5VXG7_9HYPH|nr:outer membrane beta-barrel protein [Devosia sp.]WEK06162.1 MAG: outer membrane beta-barrel protein [Devosia sp.]
MFARSLTLGVAAAALLAGGAQAADLIIPTTPQPIYEAAGFDWEGLYAGARIGGVFADDAAGDTASGFSAGGAVGVNFLPVDPFLVGAEVTGDYVWSDDFLDQSQFFANLRAGAVVTDSVLVYALGGVGVITNDVDSYGAYQLGGGVEVAVTDAVTVRGEVVGQGFFDDEIRDDFFDSAKATVGVFYHF